nr:hypothetical protein GCM10020185_01040 [Pseudomonas brassicacearum subsp. brassicacearum]
MNDEEQQQLETVIKRVTQMAESQYSGREAELIKHFAYYFLEVSLTNTMAEWMQVFPVTALPPICPRRRSKRLITLRVISRWLFMLVLAEKSTGFDASYALEIAEALKSEFAGYSALVRRDLVMRCFACEFRDVSVGIYCWLIVAGVLPVTKKLLRSDK